MLTVDVNSRDSLRDYLKHSLVDRNEVAVRDLTHYVDYAFQRFMVTLEYLPPQPGRVLGLGANPYFLTLLMKKLLSYELEIANFFHDEADPRIKQLQARLDLLATHVNLLSVQLDLWQAESRADAAHTAQLTAMRQHIDAVRQTLSDNSE